MDLNLDLLDLTEADLHWTSDEEEVSMKGTFEVLFKFSRDVMALV
jgi:hypothetical protein